MRKRIGILCGFIFLVGAARDDRMKSFTRMLFLLLLILGTAITVNATPINPGFETGQLTPWSFTTSTTYGAVMIGTTLQVRGTEWQAPDGQHFAVLHAGSVGFLEINQTIDLYNGETISGWAAVSTHSVTGPYSIANVTLYDSNNNIVFSDLLAPLPNERELPWTSWTYTSATDGQYRLQMGLQALQAFAPRDHDSYAMFDMPGGNPVPEPTTMLLFSTGLAGLGVFRRKSKKA